MNHFKQLLRSTHLPWVKKITVLCGLLAIILASNLVFVNSQLFIQDKLKSITQAQIEISVDGRGFTAQERQKITGSSDASFETKTIQLGIDSESAGDFRVGTARIVIVDDDFPYDKWLGNQQNSAPKPGEAWVSSVFANELGLKIGDEFKILDYDFTFSRELIGFANGIFSSKIETPNILVHEKNFTNLNRQLLNPNSTNKYFIEFGGDPQKYIDNMYEQLTLTDLTIKIRNINKASRLEKMRSAQSLAEITVLGTLISTFVVLMAIMSHYISVYGVKNYRKLIFEFGQLCLISIITIGICALSIGKLMQLPSIILAFNMSNFYYLSITSIAAIEIFMKPENRFYYYAWALQFLLISLLIFVQYTVFTSSSSIIGFVCMMLAILVGLELVKYVPKHLKIICERHFNYSVLGAIICTVMVGLLIEGATRLGRPNTYMEELTVFNLNETSASHLSDILDEAEIPYVQPEQLLVVQINTVNGHEVETNPSNRTQDPLWIAINDDPKNTAETRSGYLWNADEKVPYMAMTTDKAESIGVRVGDKIGLFSHGVEAVVELKAIYNSQDPTNNKFVSGLSNSPILDLVSGANYIRFNVEKRMRDLLIAEISTKLPEAAIISNASENWIMGVMDRNTDQFLESFEWYYGSIAIGLLFIMAIRMPTIPYSGLFQGSPWATTTNLKLYAPMIAGYISIYVMSMLGVFGVFFFFGQHFFGMGLGHLSAITWIGVAVFILIFAMISLGYQVFRHRIVQ